MRLVALVALAATAYGAAATAAPRMQAEFAPGPRQAGQPLTLRLTGADGSGPVCLVAVAGSAPCSSAPAGPGGAELELVPPRPGRWAAAFDRRLGPDLTVAPPRERLRVLATGDSLVYQPWTKLSDRLEPEVEVLEEARLGTGITYRRPTNWIDYGRAQAERLRPDALFMFLGGNDALALRGRGGSRVGCCGRDWEHLYARRASKVMRANLRGGHTWVWWLTLPTPADRDRVAPYRAINSALRRAAAGLAGRVQLIDLAEVLSPGGRFRQTVRWRGRSRDVRAPDGIHLAEEGSAIAATLMEERLEEAGLLP